MSKTIRSKAMPFVVLAVSLFLTVIVIAYSSRYPVQLTQLLPRSGAGLIWFQAITFSIGLLVSIALFLVVRSTVQARSAANSATGELRLSKESQQLLNAQLEQYRT